MVLFLSIGDFSPTLSLSRTTSHLDRDGHRALLSSREVGLERRGEEHGSVLGQGDQAWTGEGRMSRMVSSQVVSSRIRPLRRASKVGDSTPQTN